MRAKERFEQPFETQPFTATAKTEFGLFSEGTGVLVIFKEGETVSECAFGRREYEDKRKWVVRFDKHGLLFQLPAPDFFKIFDA